MEEKKVVQDDEIDLIELAQVIWSKRWFISKVTGVFMLLGIIIAFTSKVEYEASCKLLPESQEGSPDLGGLGGLAGLAGFDISGLNSYGGLSPDLYPEIVNSTPFLNKLINSPIYFEKRDTTISSFTYFKEIDQPSLIGRFVEYIIGLPGKVKSIINSSNESVLINYEMVRFSKEDWKIIEKYKDRLTISVDAKTSIIDISAQMPDPVASAMVANLLVQELTNNITQYKIEKSLINLDFINERFKEAKAQYESKLQQLARFTDTNRNISNSVVQLEYDRIQNELNIAFEVYKGLATQLEQAKIRVKQETPAFTTLEPVRVPESKSKPQRMFKIVTFVFLGLAFSLIVIIVQKILLDRSNP